MNGPGQPLQPWSWLIVPTLVCLAATLVFATPIRFLGLGLPEPVFPMILAFSWANIRPSILGPFLLLLSGLFLDLFWHGALGLWALCLLVVYGLGLLVRNLMAGQPVLVLWFWYGAFCLTAYAIAYLLVFADAHMAPSLIGTGINLLVTVALFPFSRAMIERFEDQDIRFR
jgi:rod shape-determining protein MreD